MNKLIHEFKDAWEHFDESSLRQLEKLYSPTLAFVDPIGKIDGRDEFLSHLESQCKNLIECRFWFDEELEVISNNRASLMWRMTMRHKAIGGGKATETRGVSIIRFDALVTFHGDYFDLGQMVYQHLPILGGVVRTVNSKLQYQPGKGRTV
jgi:hypothetical protein